MIRLFAQGSKHLYPSQSNHKPNDDGTKTAVRKVTVGDYPVHSRYPNAKRQNVISVQLAPIPGSPNATDISTPPSLSSKPSLNLDQVANGKVAVKIEPDRPTKNSPGPQPKLAANRRQHQHLNLHVALQELNTSPIRNASPSKSTEEHSISAYSGDDYPSTEETPITPPTQRDIPPLRLQEPPKSQPTVGGKGISSPILNHGKVSCLKYFPASYLLFFFLIGSRNFPNESC